MATELNMLKLVAAPQAKPAPKAPSAPSREQGEEEREGFSSVLDRVSSEAQEKSQPQPKPAEQDSNRNPENGLAAGKEENLAGEEGSSRSASLSPNEPDQVEKPEKLETDPLEQSETAQLLISNAGGELPFLVPVPEVAAQAVQEIPVEQGVDLSALLLAQASQTVAETAVPVAPEIVEAPVNPEVLVAQLPQNELDQALALLKPVAEKALPQEAIEIPKELLVPKKEQVPVAPIASEAVAVQAPVVQAVVNETEFKIEEKDEEIVSFRPQDPRSEKNLRGEEKADGSAEKRVESNITPSVSVFSKQEEEAKPDLDLFRELEGSMVKVVRKQSSNAGAPEQVAANDASKEANASDFSQFLREFQGIEKTRDPQAPQAAAPTEERRPLPGSVEDQVFRQIRMRLEPGLSQVDIKLLPPELGSVRIRFELEGDRMKAHVEAKEAATAALLQRHLPELKSSMVQAGFDVKEFEITTSSAFLGLGLQHENMNEAQNEEQRQAARFWGGRNAEQEEMGLESGELVVSRADGGIDYVI